MSKKIHVTLTDAEYATIKDIETLGKSDSDKIRFIVKTFIFENKL